MLASLHFLVKERKHICSFFLYPLINLGLTSIFLVLADDIKIGEDSEMNFQVFILNSNILYVYISLNLSI